MRKILILVLAATLWFPAGAALAGDERSMEPADEKSAFFRDANFNATLYYFQRYRDRYDVDKHRYFTNLSHAAGQLSLDFESVYINDFIGFDFGIFGSYDFYNNGGRDHRGAPDHEMGFFPWRDPWSADWNKPTAKDAASVYKALVKVKAGSAWARAGYFQPQGPGVLGVNWAFLPGTYQGAEMGADFGRLSLAAAWANQYKAPWYTKVYKFRKNDGETEVGYVWSLGARYEVIDGLTMELAYGESQNYLWNAHFKAKYNLTLGEDKLYLTWQTYLMDDLTWDGPVNDNFSGMAIQQYLAAVYQTGPWTGNLEFTCSRAPNGNPGNVRYFAYRLISGYGGAKGAYEPWWDLRSDWDHHNEKAVFIKLGRDLSDLGLAGVRAAVSGACGWGGEAYGYTEKFREAAFGFNLSYTFSQGWLEGAVAAMHFTRYDNKTDIGSWEFSGNAFQDERDIKFSLVIPLTK